jgi:hypothetical protein
MDNREVKAYVNKQYLRTFVQHEDKWFFVSTINRLISSEYPIELSETMVYEWDEKKGETGEWIGEFGGPSYSSAQHCACVEFLLRNGSISKLKEEL